jgi:sulfur carrier protein ThiS
MISIKITIYGNIEIEGIDKDGCLQVDEHSSVRQILTRLALDPRLVDHLPVIVNGEVVDRTYQPGDGEELILLAPVSGGVTV